LLGLGEAFGLADALTLALGDGDGDGEADTVTVGDGVMAARGAAGDWLPRYSASGTTTSPTMTVRTNVTAPHSRLKNAAFNAPEILGR
jgi:hypothetical protein